MQFRPSSGKSGTNALILITLFVATFDSSIASGATVWDVTTGQPLTNSPFANILSSATFSPDGALIVSSTPNGPYRIWYTGPAGPHRGEWTIRIGQGRYGFTHLKNTGPWPRFNFLIWNNLAYRIPPALLFSLLAIILLLLFASAGLMFRRRSESNKS